MGVTSIPWTHFTYNLWWGCSRVSPGCVRCYASTVAERYGQRGLWHRTGPRRWLSPATLARPRKWNRDAGAAGVQYLVFAGSMFDLFERHPVAEIAARQDAERAKFWALVAETPNLIWQLLTKRIEEVADIAPWGDAWPDNVWLGTSVEDQQRAAERLAVLNGIDARVRWASVEPQIERVHMGEWLAQPGRQGVDWVVVGGESQGGARPFDLSWARDIRDQVAASDARFFFKQTGSVFARAHGLTGKGEALEEVPADLRVRDYPPAYELAA